MDELEEKYIWDEKLSDDWRRHFGTDLGANQLSARLVRNTIDSWCEMYEFIIRFYGECSGRKYTLKTTPDGTVELLKHYLMPKFLRRVFGEVKYAEKEVEIFVIYPRLRVELGEPFSIFILDTTTKYGEPIRQAKCERIVDLKYHKLGCLMDKQNLDKLLGEVKSAFEPNKITISIASNKTLSKLARYLPGKILRFLFPVQEVEFDAKEIDRGYEPLLPNEPHVKVIVGL